MQDQELDRQQAFAAEDESTPTSTQERLRRSPYAIRLPRP